MYKHIYGPVPSRRLGISLGIDLIPHKVCNFNCLYCECGKSPRLYNERKEYIPADEILSEIRDFMKNNPAPDFLTFSGSGEPTLHSKIGAIINTIKSEFPKVKVAVLTNSGLLYDPNVRKELLEADVVLPNLDAATEDAYIRIDRPHPDYTLDKVIQGIIDFTKEFKAVSPDKQIWLEVFIVEGINTDPENIKSFRETIAKINPDRVQLNTLDRPGAEDWIKPAPKDLLEKILQELKLPNVEIISKFKHREEMKSYRKDAEETILDTIARRPSTIRDIAEVLGMTVQEVGKYLDILENDKKVAAEIRQGDTERGVFYKIRG